MLSHLNLVCPEAIEVNFTSKLIKGYFAVVVSSLIMAYNDTGDNWILHTLNITTSNTYLLLASSSADIKQKDDVQTIVYVAYFFFLLKRSPVAVYYTGFYV